MRDSDASPGGKYPPGRHTAEIEPFPSTRGWKVQGMLVEPLRVKASISHQQSRPGRAVTKVLAAVATASKQPFRIEQVELPDPARDEVLIKITGTLLRG